MCESFTCDLWLDHSLPKYLVEQHFLRCVCVRVLTEETRVRIGGPSKPIVLPSWMGLIHSTNSPNRTKKWRKSEYSLPSGWSGTSVFCPAFPGPQTSRLRLESTPLALWLRSYNGSVPGPAACWWQTVQLLSLNSSMSQYLH